MSCWVFNLLIFYILVIIVINIYTFLLFSRTNFILHNRLAACYKHANKVSFGNWMKAPPVWSCESPPEAVLGGEEERSPSLPFLNSESVCSFTVTRGTVSSQRFKHSSFVEWGFFFCALGRQERKSVMDLIFWSLDPL